MNRMDSTLSRVCFPHAVEFWCYCCLAAPALKCLVDPVVIPDAACATMADWLIVWISLPFSIPLEVKCAVEKAVANLSTANLHFHQWRLLWFMTNLVMSPHVNIILSLRLELAQGQKVQLTLPQHIFFFRQTVICHPRVTALWWQGQHPECAVIWEMSQQHCLSVCIRRSMISSLHYCSCQKAF